ncbi:MAG: hypothetical protein R2726_06025 [Acidimicrobiales bacterium]
METRRWTNPSQPQTLYMATFLLYFGAALGALYGLLGGSIIQLGLAVLEALCAYGIANERKIAYWGAVVVAGLSLVPALLALIGGLGVIFNLAFLIGLVFPVALFALLVHPQSRDYARIWFS